MGKTKAIDKSFSQLTKDGLKETRKKLIAKEKKRKGYLVVAGKDGSIKKISASQLK